MLKPSFYGFFDREGTETAFHTCLKLAPQPFDTRFVAPDEVSQVYGNVGIPMSLGPFADQLAKVLINPDARRPGSYFGASTISIWRPSVRGYCSTLATSAVSTCTRCSTCMPS